MENMNRLVAEINLLAGYVVPRQRGRRVQYATFEKGHPDVKPEGWVVVHIGRPQSRNILSLSCGAALEFIAQVERHAGEGVAP